MPRSVAEIQADIDRVKAQIAYNQKYSQGFAQPSTKVGWNSYIINNDRGLLDQYQNRENNWKQLMAQQEASKTMQLADKMDEYNLNYLKAISARNYAQQALDMDKSDDPAIKSTLQRNLDDANASLAYWSKKLGKNTEPAVSTPKVNEELNDNVEPKEVITQEDQKQITEAATSEDEWTNEAKQKAIVEANKIKDPGDRAKALRDIKKKGDTKEEAAAAKAKRKKDFDKRWADLPKTANGDPKPGALAKAKKDPEFAKLYKEFKGDK